MMHTPMQKNKTMSGDHRTSSAAPSAFPDIAVSTAMFFLFFLPVRLPAREHRMVSVGERMTGVRTAVRMNRMSAQAV